MGGSWRQVSEEPLPELGHTEASFFEALFVHGVECPPELVAALAGIGVELGALRPRYPSTTWIAAIDVARSYLYPQASSKELADRELGRKFLAGFLRTIPGRLVGAVLPFMSGRSLLMRAGRYTRLGRDDLSVEFEEGSDGGARLLVVDAATARAHFFQGSVEAALDRTASPSRVTLEEVDAWRFELHVRFAN